MSFFNSKTQSFRKEREENSKSEVQNSKFKMKKGNQSN